MKKSCGAKRRIQGCYNSDSKEKWGCFLIQNFIVHQNKNNNKQPN